MTSLHHIFMCVDLWLIMMHGENSQRFIYPCKCKPLFIFSLDYVVETNYVTSDIIVFAQSMVYVSVTGTNKQLSATKSSSYLSLLFHCTTSHTLT